MADLGVIGIDPGAPIAMALISPKGNLLATAGRETVAGAVSGGWKNSPEIIAGILNKWADQGFEVVYCIENAAPRPGEGLVSAAKYVGSWWLVRGIAATQGKKTVLVAPSVWKASMNLKGGEQNKDLSRLKAAELWPKQAYRFKRKMDNDLAEAALIGYWKWAQIKHTGAV